MHRVASINTINRLTKVQVRTGKQAKRIHGDSTRDSRETGVCVRC